MFLNRLSDYIVLRSLRLAESGLLSGPKDINSFDTHFQQNASHGRRAYVTRQTGVWVVCVWVVCVWVVCVWVVCVWVVCVWVVCI